MRQNLNVITNDSKQAISYIIHEITHICRNMDRRAPGSNGERKAGEYLAHVLEKECGCREVKTESFKEHPASFYSYFYFSMTFDCLCAVFFFIQPWLSIVFGLTAYLIFLLHFVLYKKILDPLFPEKESINITALRPCSGEVRQRVFLNGHIDAAWEFPVNYHFGGVAMVTPPILAIIGVMYYIVLSVCVLCGAGTWTHTAGLWGLLFIPFFIIVAFTYNPKRVVDGANDNLSGCYMGIAVLHEMERLSIMLDHTELGVILTGSEEAGLRGAKAWCKDHREDYRDVPTYIISYDTIHDPNQLMVNMKDLNGTVTADQKLGELFLQSAKEAGVPCKKGIVPFLGGATDSAAFTQGGFRSFGVTGLSHMLEDYYHTRRDSYDNLNRKGLENCYITTIKMLEKIDS